MHALRVARCLCLVLTFTLASDTASSAQTTGQQPPPSVPYDPTVGQQGKDVVWVPTGEKLVETMLDLAQLKPDDNLIDLGSGDGRTVIAAAKRGATALGIEYNPDMVALSKTRAAEAGVAERATFTAADLFASDFTHATVITMFLRAAYVVRSHSKTDAEAKQKAFTLSMEGVANKIECPLLVIAAGLDRLCPPEDAQRLAREPRARPSCCWSKTATTSRTTASTNTVVSPPTGWPGS